MSRLKFAQKNFQPRPSAGLVKHRFYRIPLFWLNVLVDLHHLYNYVILTVIKCWENESKKSTISKFSKYVNVGEISYTIYTTHLNGKWATRPRFARHAPQKALGDVSCNVFAKHQLLLLKIRKGSCISLGAFHKVRTQ